MTGPVRLSDTQEFSVATLPDPQDVPLLDRRARPVAVTGPAGFVGTRVCRALADAGYKIRALVRSPEKAAGRLADLPVEFKVGDLRDPAYVRDAFEGCEAVIHLAAIAIERGNQTYESINTGVTQIVIDAARAAQVLRLVHMSQNGSDSQSPYRFLRSKGVAQDLVRDSGLQWTIFRPSVIFGPDDEFVNVLARLVRLTPVVFPLPGGGRARFQPIFVDDVARACMLALDRKDTIGQMYPLGGPAPLSLREMAERILAAMQTHRRIVGIPVPLVRPVVALMQRVLPNPPVTSSLLDLLAIDNTVPGNALTTTFGITPTPFAPEELRYLQRITAGQAIRSLFKS